MDSPTSMMTGRFDTGGGRGGWGGSGRSGEDSVQYGDDNFGEFGTAAQPNVGGGGGDGGLRLADHNNLAGALPSGPVRRAGASKGACCSSKPPSDTVAGEAREDKGAEKKKSEGTGRGETGWFL